MPRVLRFTNHLVSMLVKIADTKIILTMYLPTFKSLSLSASLVGMVVSILSYNLCNNEYNSKDNFSATILLIKVSYFGLAEKLHSSCSYDSLNRAIQLSQLLLYLPRPSYNRLMQLCIFVTGLGLWELCTKFPNFSQNLFIMLNFILFMLLLLSLFPIYNLNYQSK